MRWQAVSNISKEAYGRFNAPGKVERCRGTWSLAADCFDDWMDLRSCIV
jgi:hypothetical protein